VIRASKADFLVRRGTQLSISRLPGKRRELLLADKGYAHDSTRAALRRRRIRHVIPERSDPQARRVAKGARGGRPPAMPSAPPSTAPASSSSPPSSGFNDRQDSPSRVRHHHEHVTVYRRVQREGGQRWPGVDKGNRFGSPFRSKPPALQPGRMPPRGRRG